MESESSGKNWEKAIQNTVYQVQKPDTTDRQLNVRERESSD
jgi:hypothetical protein